MKNNCSSKSLFDVFPAPTTFSNESHKEVTQRIAQTQLKPSSRPLRLAWLPWTS